MTLLLDAVVEPRIEPLRGRREHECRAAVLGWWRGLDTDVRLVLNKLLTRAFRGAVSRRPVTRALAETSGIEPARPVHGLVVDPVPTFAGAWWSRRIAVRP